MNIKDKVDDKINVIVSRSTITIDSVCKLKIFFKLKPLMTTLTYITMESKSFTSFPDIITLA